MAWSPPTPSTDFEAVGVYIFQGGFTIGMSETFHIKGHLEDGMFGVKTFKANFPRVPVWINPDRWPVERFKGIDVVYGNPPCAPWSPIGSSMRHGSENWRSDPNVDCARRLIDYGLQVQPKVWVMESVPQIQKSEFILDMAQIWLEAGYAFTLVRQDAKFWKLPQQRRRCFMVAHKVRIPWQVFPEDLVQDPVTAGDCLETAPSVGVHPEVPDIHRHLVPRTTVGRSMRAVWEDDNPDLRGVDGRDVPVPGRPLIMIHRIDPSIPSGVIIGQNVYIHPFEDRFIGHLEAARLCGYPDDWQWVNGYEGRTNRGNYKSGVQPNDYIAQIAKAVTPPAGKFLGKNLALGLKLNEPAEVKSQRATFWAPSMRVNDFRLISTVEDWSVEHECTVRSTEGALQGTSVV